MLTAVTRTKSGFDDIYLAGVYGNRKPLSSVYITVLLWPACGGVLPMSKRVFALGLDPTFVDLSEFPEFTPELVRAFIDSQMERLRDLGYEVDACLVDTGDTAETVVAQHLASNRFDVALIGAGLRAPDQLLLFERLLNLIHAQAPEAKICFNTTPADSAEAVQRWA